MHFLRPFARAWLPTFLAMLALDALWLGVVATDLYQQEMGSLVAK